MLYSNAMRTALILALIGLTTGPASASGKACVVSGFKLTNKFGSTATVNGFSVDVEGNSSGATFKVQSKNLEGGQSSTIQFDSKDTEFNKKEVWGIIEKYGCTEYTNCRKDSTTLYVELDPNNENKPRGPIWHYKLTANAAFCDSRCEFENTECVAPLDPNLKPRN